ncbi:MAG: TRAP transporter substrate-binding protein [Pseudomonadota bacterium]
MKTFASRLAIAGLAMFGASASAAAQEVTLTLAHFLSPKAPPHAEFLEPWAKKIEAESDGRIAIEIFPSMTLGGKPPELYRQLRDGAADIVWTVTGYTPGVFPRSEVFELPTVHKNSARATTLAIQDSFELVAEDFADIKPLLVHVHAGQALHLVDGCIGDPSELGGLKLRTPSRTGAWMIEAWGAEPVGMPVPALPQALSKGTIDGTLIPFEVMPPFKVHELTTCSITGTDDNRFGTAVFLFAMNQDSYDGLPDDLKAVIDANSGMAIAEETGALWDRIEGPGQEMQKKTGSPVEALDQAGTDALDALGEQVVQRWVEEASSNGIDAEALVAVARDAIAAHSN